MSKKCHISLPVFLRGKSSFESNAPSTGCVYADSAAWGGELWSKELCWVFLQQIQIKKSYNPQHIMQYHHFFFRTTITIAPSSCTHAYTLKEVKKTASIFFFKVRIFKDTGDCEQLREVEKKERQWRKKEGLIHLKWSFGFLTRLYETGGGREGRWREDKPESEENHNRVKNTKNSIKLMMQNHSNLLPGQNLWLIKASLKCKRDTTVVFSFF